MSMVSYWVAQKELAKHEREVKILNQRIRERIAHPSDIRSLRKELVEAYKIKPEEGLSLEEAVNSLNHLFKEVGEQYRIEKHRIDVLKNTEDNYIEPIKDIVLGFVDYIKQIVESCQRIREFNYKQNSYRGKLPTLTRILYNLKNFASPISNQINVYLREPTHVGQTKMLQYLDSSLEQIIRKYRREIGRIIPESGKLVY